MMLPESLVLSLVVIDTIHVCVFTDISNGRDRHQPHVIILL